MTTATDASNTRNRGKKRKVAHIATPRCEVHKSRQEKRRQSASSTYSAIIRYRRSESERRERVRRQKASKHWEEHRCLAAKGTISRCIRHTEGRSLICGFCFTQHKLHLNYTYSGELRHGPQKDRGTEAMRSSRVL
jgi:hypothetical protein